MAHNTQPPSRILRVSPLSRYTLEFLAQPLVVSPSMIWCSRSYEIDALWLFFDSPASARQALVLYAESIPVFPALETELEPLAKLEPFDASQHVIARKNGPPQYNSNPQSSHVKPSNPPARTDMNSLDMSSGAFDYDFTLSSNPPNPKSNIRSGDWICSSSTCNAHNFGRNLTCIGCGNSRTTTSSIPHSMSVLPNQPYTQPPVSLSPRFLSPPSSGSSAASSPRRNEPLSVHVPPPNSASSPPLLTPSGRGFARGGSVRNVCDDPLVPCIMYWPDNEALPERGQIRPAAYTGSPHPPILNTGNRGPIAHQPGDWICLKCNYLNWRRRKVCQTCFPYAEGNGDSISAAVQAERIALLTSVLHKHAAEGSGFVPSPLASPFTSSDTSSLTSSPTASMFSGEHRPPRMLGGVHHQQLRSQSMTPPLALAERHALATRMNPGASTGRRAQSHYNLHAQYSSNRHHSDTIYQTSLNAPTLDSSYRPRVSASAQSSPIARRRPLGSPFLQETDTSRLYAPRPLLPSFLHDIVDEPQEHDGSLPSPLLSLHNLSLDEMPHGSHPHSMRVRQTSLNSTGSSTNSSPFSTNLELEKIWGDSNEYGAGGSRLLGGEPTKGMWSAGFGPHVGEPKRRSPPTAGVIGPPSRSARINDL